MVEMQLTDDLRIQTGTSVRLKILSVFIAGLLIAGSNEVFGQSKAAGAELTIKITYVGNEGVLIQGNGKKVLIDGLHREYKPAYHHLSETQLSEAEKGSPPFDDIDLLLVTHIHRDHFSAESVGRYLENNPRTVLIGSQQVADSLEVQFDHFAEIASRVRAVTPATGAQETLKINDIEVNVLRLGHTNQRFDWVHNLGYLVTIGGNTVLHIGDAAMSAQNFMPFNLAEEQIDVACLPFWFFIFESGRHIIRNQIQANYMAAVHIDPAKAEEYNTRIKEFFPEAVPLVRLFSVFPDDFFK